GYNMGDYFSHWLKVGKKLKNPPKIFSINWFRLDGQGKFIWPGFGDNIRVLKWIIERVSGKVPAKETPIGLLPETKDLELSGLDITEEEMKNLFEVNMPDWKPEADDTGKFFARFGDKIPKELMEELKSLA
ncbi:MAG TPA: phosphoenolpyruvate carboxykinase domain-containing protein, partial [bacterium]|nr:phosphoenolpyruvate carboxykinase domain-containing protein [bacterium]